MPPRISRTCLILLTLSMATPARGQNPWAKVPAFSKACYTKGDPFGDQVQKAIEEVEAARDAQRETNISANATLNQLNFVSVVLFVPNQAAI